jgi:hypothetical protein
MKSRRHSEQIRAKVNFSENFHKHYFSCLEDKTYGLIGRQWVTPVLLTLWHRVFLEIR